MKSKEENEINMVNYIEGVAVNSIDCVGDDKCRYYLYVPFETKVNNNTALVIMKNPSKANGIHSDKTVNNVLQFCKYRYGSVYMFNVFPFYSTNSDEPNTIIRNSPNFEEIMQENMEYLEKKLKLADDIIVAWGRNEKKELEKYFKSILKVLERKNKQLFQ